MRYGTEMLLAANSVLVALISRISSSSVSARLQMSSEAQVPRNPCVPPASDPSTSALPPRAPLTVPDAIGVRGSDAAMSFER